MFAGSEKTKKYKTGFNLQTESLPATLHKDFPELEMIVPVFTETG